MAWSSSAARYVLPRSTLRTAVTSSLAADRLRRYPEAPSFHPEDTEHIHRPRFIALGSGMKLDFLLSNEPRSFHVP